MTDPTIQKTWEFEINGLALQSTTQGSTQAHLDRRETMLGIVSRMTNTNGFATMTTPWTIVQSSDGSTAGTPGPGWADADDLVWRDEDSPGTAFSWILLQQTGISATFQLLIALESDTVGDDGSQIFASVGQIAYGAGGTTTTPPAGPADERVLRNDDGTSQGHWGTGSDASNPGNLRWHVSMSSDGQCTRVLIFINTVNTGFWCFDKPDNPATGWTNPYLAVISGSNDASTNQCSNLLFNTAANMKGRFSGTDTTMFLSSEGFANSTIGSQMTRNQLNNTWPVSEMGIASETSTFIGRMGTMFDLWWGEDLSASGRLFPQTGTKLYVSTSSMIFPWDGSSILQTK